MKHKLKVWTVQWTRQGASEFDVEPKDSVIGVETAASFTVKCSPSCHRSGFHFGSSLAVFGTKQAAKSWMIAEGAGDFEVKPATLEIDI